ncbi:MAG: pyridoxine 5'-phosphate synthase [Bauldia sp.]|uniref:pyridoxine 5'-phosphate synthase n=1 Tax=Bauldia sp. TaxID=2575872 RepID=UPI001D53CB15|nr:pyridoxine 5'-phosphate synthase [Bauldia sp.]MCB1494774.1 pyridoxine 5'-phosphate synthase [Bauldia sp.]
MTASLSVNLNAIAQLRNRRDLPWPSVTGMGRIALQAGARGLTVHPRPDERHVRRSDVPDLARLIAGEFPDREFNIEGNPDARFVEIVETVRPTQVTLVPDDIRQATSDHGWDVAAHHEFLVGIVARLRQSGMRVSLFIDPDPAVPALARDVGADRVEIFTGPYGSAMDPAVQARELDKVVATGNAAKDAGLGLNAGHDLTLANLPPLVAALPHLAEVSIGHALTADALQFGMAETVLRYREACGEII